MEDFKLSDFFLELEEHRETIEKIQKGIMPDDESVKALESFINELAGKNHSKEANHLYIKALEMFMADVISFNELKAVNERAYATVLHLKENPLLESDISALNHVLRMWIDTADEYS